MVEQERYKALEESSQEEIDELAVQLTEAQERIATLEGQVAEVQQRRGGAGLGGGGGRSADAQLKEENVRFVMQLVAKQMELAQLSESETMLKRDLSRAKEVNVKLAAKLTELEAKARR